jgi:hypothetical protein
MRYMASITVLVAALSFSGCGTGVVQMDRDSYMVSQTSTACGFASAAGSKAGVYREANQFCAAKGMQVSTISLTGRDGIIGARCAGADLIFRCSPPGTMDANSADQLRQDVQRDRINNQIDQAVTPRPVFTLPPPPVTTNCTSYGSAGYRSTSCTTR